MTLSYWILLMNFQVLMTEVKKTRENLYIQVNRQKKWMASFHFILHLFLQTKKREKEKSLLLLYKKTKNELKSFFINIKCCVYSKSPFYFLLNTLFHNSILFLFFLFVGFLFSFLWLNIFLVLNYKYYQSISSPRHSNTSEC